MYPDKTFPLYQRSYAMDCRPVMTLINKHQRVAIYSPLINCEFFSNGVC